MCNSPQTFIPTFFWKGSAEAASDSTRAMLTQAAKTGVTVNFVYDPFHRNIRKDDGTNKTRYIYAGDQILAEYNDTSGALINRHVYGFEADDPIIQVTSGGTVTYNTQDHVGSIIARTDSSGAILSKYKYAPFGESPSLSGTIFGFTGQRFDSETGLYHFKARYYDPVTGRFLQPDSIGYGAGLNMYRYGQNDPLRRIDPTGSADRNVKIIRAIQNSNILNAPGRTENRPREYSMQIQANGRVTRHYESMDMGSSKSGSENFWTPQLIWDNLFTNIDVKIHTHNDIPNRLPELFSDVDIRESNRYNYRSVLISPSNHVYIHEPDANGPKGDDDPVSLGARQGKLLGRFGDDGTFYPAFLEGRVIKYGLGIAPELE